MKLPITIEYNSGEQATYVAQPPEWAKWEKTTGHTISQAKEKLGMWDLMFLAYMFPKSLQNEETSATHLDCVGGYPIHLRNGAAPGACQWQALPKESGQP